MAGRVNIKLEMAKPKFKLFHLLWLTIAFFTFVFIFFSEGSSEPFLFGAPLALWGGIVSSFLFLAVAVAAATSVKNIDDV